MIGTILSMHYVGKRKWTLSILFWIVYWVVMLIVSSILGTITQSLMYGGIVVSAVIFILLAHYWRPLYGFRWFDALKIFAIAFVIDLIVVVIIAGILIAFLGYTFPWGGTAQFFPI